MSDHEPILVTDEYFDYLHAETKRPAKSPNPAMVELLRSTRGQTEHIGADRDGEATPMSFTPIEGTALTAAEQARLDTIDAAPWAEEALWERVARAIQAEWRMAGGWIMHDGAARRLADAALAVIRPPVDGVR